MLSYIVTIVTYLSVFCNNSYMGRVIRLRDHIDKWLSSIDENLEVALNKVQVEHISHKKIIESIESIKEDVVSEIKELKSY